MPVYGGWVWGAGPRIDRSAVGVAFTVARRRRWGSGGNVRGRRGAEVAMNGVIARVEAEVESEGCRLQLAARSRRCCLLGDEEEDVVEPGRRSRGSLNSITQTR